MNYIFKARLAKKLSIRENSVTKVKVSVISIVDASKFFTHVRYDAENSIRMINL